MPSESWYENNRNGASQRQRKYSNSARDIGPPPAVVNQRRRKRCRKNLKLFLTTYFPEAFGSKFGDDHIEFIKSVQETILRGGQFMVLMPRGSG